MALTRLNNTPAAGQVTYRFQYSGTTAVIDRKADQAAHYLFDAGYGDHGADGLRPYSDLSPAEKLALLDQHVRRVIMDLSRAYKVNADQEAARAAATQQEESEVIT